MIKWLRRKNQWKADIELKADRTSAILIVYRPDGSKVNSWKITPGKYYDTLSDAALENRVRITLEECKREDEGPIRKVYYS